MRFAYIDSQGKEVPIPSADALRLRIELGAIVDTTEFYDANTDRWAPAAEHEIFRTLRREIESSEGDGFVAPPPTAFSAPEEPAPESAADSPPEIDASDARVEESTEEPVEESSEKPLEESFEEPVEEPFEESGDLVEPTGEDTAGADVVGDDDMDFSMGGLDGLTLADEPVVPEESEEDPDPAPMEATADEPAPTDGLPEVEEEPEAEEESEDDDFDFGSFGTLELEDEPVVDDEPEPEPEAPSADEPPEPGDDGPRWDVASEVSGLEPQGDTEEEDLELAGVDDDLEVEETSMADYDPEEPPSWMEDEPESASSEPSGPGVPEAGLAAAGTAATAGPVPDEEGAAPPARERPDDPYDRAERPKRPRSGPPQRKLTPKTSGGVGKLAGILVVVALLGGGAWFGLEMMAGGDAAGEGAAATVALPDLPTELQPQLRQLAQRASIRMVERFDSLPARLELSEGPGDEWLGGAYLANAGEFTDIAVYWRNMEELVARMRENEDTFFEQAYRDEVTAANLTRDNADLLLERGLAGFEAAAPDRAIIYDQLQGVVDAAMDLHLFLMENEGDIDFEPARGGVSRDPLLEAVPVTSALGEEMMSRVVEITNALDALGYLDVVATDPLLDIVGEKLVATGIR